MRPLANRRGIKIEPQGGECLKITIGGMLASAFNQQPAYMLPGDTLTINGGTRAEVFIAYLPELGLMEMSKDELEAWKANKD
jgi:hypothetical protein